jgi:predicted deacylase
MSEAAYPPPIQFSVRLTPPDLDPWVPGNCGVSGFLTRESGRAGPHVALVSLIHGNEYAGAIVLDTLLRKDFRPLRGQLTFGFANLAAFARFDPKQPAASRYVDEDLNRVWDEAVLEGPRRSCELDRAREMRRIFDTVDFLLDLHSMLWPSEPLILCNTTEKARTLALAIAEPSLVVVDPGHATGRRLIDYARFRSSQSAAAANLVEAGQHWQQQTVTITFAAVAKFLRTIGLAAIDDPILPPPPAQSQQPRLAEVTAHVVALTDAFRFVEPFEGGRIVPHEGTLIAWDGETEIRTPYDNCLLVMPSLLPRRGHTAVRLARFVSP